MRLKALIEEGIMTGETLYMVYGNTGDYIAWRYDLPLPHVDRSLSQSLKQK